MSARGGGGVGVDGVRAGDADGEPPEGVGGDEILGLIVGDVGAAAVRDAGAYGVAAIAALWWAADPAAAALALLAPWSESA